MEILVEVLLALEGGQAVLVEAEIRCALLADVIHHRGLLAKRLALDAPFGGQPPDRNLVPLTFRQAQLGKGIKETHDIKRVLEAPKVHLDAGGGQLVPPDTLQCLLEFGASLAQEPDCGFNADGRAVVLVQLEMPWQEELRAVGEQLSSQAVVQAAVLFRRIDIRLVVLQALAVGGRAAQDIVELHHFAGGCVVASFAEVADVEGFVAQCGGKGAEDDSGGAHRACAWGACVCDCDVYYESVWRNVE